MKIETPLEPDELLALIHDIEQEAGRERIVHWGPRTLETPAAESTGAAPAPEAAPAAPVVQPRDDGKPVNDPSKCIYCTLCAKKCPQEAIIVDRKAKTWELNADDCVCCGTCQSACPKDAIIM